MIAIKPRCLSWQALLLSLLYFFAGAAPAADGDSAQQWLERLAKAVRERNYEGTFVYRHQGKLETLRIVHRADADGESERLYSLTGAAREIIRDNDKVTCILPDDKAVMVDRRQLVSPFSSLVPPDISGLRGNYHLELLGADRIAERAARQVAVSPRDRYRYGYRLWIDVATGLLLRADLLDETGQAVEQLMFTELHTPDFIPTSALEPTISGEGFTWYREATQAQAPAGEPEPSRWQIDGLPPGFELVLHEMRALPGKQQPVEHMLYSDGLASVSVYLEANHGEPFSGLSRLGALNAYGRVVAGHQVTVVGEVPAATVSQVGESIRLRGQ